MTLFFYVFLFLFCYIGSLFLCEYIYINTFPFSIWRVYCLLLVFLVFITWLYYTFFHELGNVFNICWFSSMEMVELTLMVSLTFAFYFHLWVFVGYTVGPWTTRVRGADPHAVENMCITFDFPKTLLHSLTLVILSNILNLFIDLQTLFRKEMK